MGAGVSAEGDAFEAHVGGSGSESSLATVGAHHGARHGFCRALRCGGALVAAAQGAARPITDSRGSVGWLFRQRIANTRWSRLDSSAHATEEKKGRPRVAEGRAIGITSSMTPLAFMSKIFVTRSLWSWLFEVLPLWLLALQSVVAVSSHGDVDGYSSSPLFGPTLRCGDKWMTSANAKIQTLLGRWSIQERHNIDEFMEGLCIPPAHRPARQILYMHIVVVVHATQGTEKPAHDAPRALMPPPSRQSLFASLPLASRALLHACACLSLLRMCALPPESPDAHAHPPLDLSRPCRVQPSDSRRGSVR
jgi:hypothetical protein